MTSKSRWIYAFNIKMVYGMDMMGIINAKAKCDI
jgi:hypothetical protein